MTFMTHDCTRIRECLQDALDDRLDREARADFERHVAHCVGCASEWDGFRSMRATMRALGLPKAPAGLRESIASAVRAEISGDLPRPRQSAKVHRFLQWSRHFAVAASVILVVTLGWIAVEQRRQEATGPAATSEGLAVAEKSVAPIDKSKARSLEAKPDEELRKAPAKPSAPVVDAGPAATPTAQPKRGEPEGEAVLVLKNPNGSGVEDRLGAKDKSAAGDTSSGEFNAPAAEGAAPPAQVLSGRDPWRDVSGGDLPNLAGLHFDRKEDASVAMFLTSLDLNVHEFAVQVPLNVQTTVDAFTVDLDEALDHLSDHVSAAAPAERAKTRGSTSGPGGEVVRRSPAEPRSAPGVGGPEGKSPSKGDKGVGSPRGLAPGAAAPGGGGGTAKSNPSPSRGGRASPQAGGARNEPQPDPKPDADRSVVTAGLAPSRDDGMTPGPEIAPAFYLVTGAQAIAKVGRLLERNGFRAREIQLRTIDGGAPSAESRMKKSSEVGFQVVRAADAAGLAPGKKYRVVELDLQRSQVNPFIGDLESVEGIRLAPVGRRVDPAAPTDPEPTDARRAAPDAARHAKADDPERTATQATPATTTLRLVILEP